MHYNSCSCQFVGKNIAASSPHALVLSRDSHVIGVLRRVLGELNVEAEVVTGPDRASEELAGRHFDVALIDCDDVHGAVGILRNVHGSPSNGSCCACAIINGVTSADDAAELGARVTLQKPLAPDRVREILREILQLGSH